MRPSIWPDWMEHIKAKSEEYGGESLAAHTWDVLVKLAELYRLRPNLPALVDAPRLWHCLFWACLVHDFGKAARGFQDRLRGGPRWPHRHEVLSVAFLDWIAPALTEEEQIWILAAVVSHHRDAAEIQRIYPDLSADPLDPLLAELDSDTVTHLWNWLNRCADSWRDALGFGADEVSGIVLVPLDVAVNLILNQGSRRTRRWLYCYSDWVAELANQPTRTRTIGILLRGLITSADHMASAHLDLMPPPVHESWQSLADRILTPLSINSSKIEPYEHQRESALTTGHSALLISPTGSGKTEAALYWALGDGHDPLARIFYTLPYQASMNAMYDRLRDEQRGFGTCAVGLQHGRAVQALYARLRESEEWAATAASQARWAKNINTLNARPIKVFSPYQMLKALFQLRGFEAMFTDYAQAAFIFDEIHAYDPERLALILGLVQHLREHYQARFFVMSATFPQIIRDRLHVALGALRVIQANDEIFERFRRHRLHLLDGDLIGIGIPRIVSDVQAGKQVLVCVNTVARAQEVLAALDQAGLPAEQLLLIHSRYTFGDRNRREQQIRDHCGLDVPRATRQPLALIATQVVEVSLNIDLDTIYSDPAPLEALLQRFGRVNRSNTRGICPVYVFREPSDGQGVYGRDRDPEQSGHIVRVTLAELERHDGEVIDEAAINSWLDSIYDDPQLRLHWMSSYHRVAEQVSIILQDLEPFTSDDQKEEQFEKLFDGVEIVPRCFERRYLEHLAYDEYIEANSYLVSISKRRFAILCRQGKILPAEAEGRRKGWIAQLDYDDQRGLQFDAPVTDRDWS